MIAALPKRLSTKRNASAVFFYHRGRWEFDFGPAGALVLDLA